MNGGMDGRVLTVAAPPVPRVTWWSGHPESYPDASGSESRPGDVKLSVPILQGGISRVGEHLMGTGTPLRQSGGVK